MDKVPEPTPTSDPDSERERESFTDGDRDFPLPHESRSWISGAKRKTTQLKFTSDSLPTKPETKPKPKHKSKRMVGSGPSPMREEQERSELLRFMSESLRKEYKDADQDRKKVIWEANKQAYLAAKRRKDEKLHREKKRTADILDMLHRVKEDPSKHDLLPPENASMEDLGKWYDERQKPVRAVPFPGVVDPPERYVEFRTGAHGRPEVRLHPEPPSAEELALRKRDELLKREEELQRRREQPKPLDVIPKVSLWPSGDEEHARKMQRAFENKTIDSSPFWAVLAFLRRWTALGGVFLLGATWTMIQIDEFALAGVLLLVGTFAFSVQIYDSKGIEDHRTATRVLKGLAGVLIVVSFVFFGAVILKKKGEKSWSNLLVKETRPEITKPDRPSPSPAQTSTPVAPTPRLTPVATPPSRPRTNSNNTNSIENKNNSLESPSPASSYVMGIVFDDESKERIQGAEVSIEGFPNLSRVKTDSNGFFKMNIPKQAGESVTVVVRMRGYVKWSKNFGVGLTPQNIPLKK